MDKDVLSCAPKLRAVSKYGVGTDNIDLDYCKEHGIGVTITRGANSQAVADYAFSMLCACARKIPAIDHYCHAQDWTKRMGLDIYGKKLGILGLGAIGKGVAERASGFHMEILAYDVYWNEDYAVQHVKALQNGQIAAAGLDVFREEPPKNPALYGLENLIMGAHCAASTQGASIAMSRMATENIVKALTK